MNNHYNLDDLYVFATVVKYGGITNAAIALNTNKSKISRRISSLENEIGHALIHRTPRSFSVTEIGQHLFSQCEELLEIKSKISSTIKPDSDTPSGLIKVSMPTLFGIHVLPHVLKKFNKKYPNIRISVRLSNNIDSFYSDGYDLIIRGGALALDKKSQIIQKKIAHVKWAFVCSPEFFKKTSIVDNPEVLGSINFLNYSYENKFQSELTINHESGKSVTVCMNPVFTSNNIDFLKSLSKNSLGVCCVPLYSCHDELRAGSLTQILNGWSTTSGFIYALYPSKKNLSGSTRIFIDFLEQNIQPLII